MAYTISQKLNIRPKYFPPVVVHVSAGDTNIPITFAIYDGSEPYTIPSGSVISVQGTRKDGASWIAACSANGNEITFTSPSAMTAVDGAGIAEVSITSGSETCGSANFLVLVERASIPNGVSYSNDPSVFQDILNYVKSGIAQGMEDATSGAVAEWLEENITPTTPAVDKSLTVGGAAADAKVTGGVIRDNLLDVLAFANKTDQTAYGITYTWNNDGICTITGTATQMTWNNLYTSPNVLPSWLELGKEYYLNAPPSGSGVRLVVYTWQNDVSTKVLDLTGNLYYTFPTDISGVTIRLQVQKGVTVNTTVTPRIIDTETKLSKFLKTIVGVDYFSGFGSYKSEEKSGVTYTWNNNGSCTITGATTNNMSFMNIINMSSDFFPFVFKAGQKYYIDIDSRDVLLQVYDVSSGTVKLIETKKKVVFTIPENMTALIIRLCVPANTTVNETVTPRMFNASALMDYINSIEVESEIIEVSRDTYENTYNISVSPTITTDTNGWLQAVDTETESETGKTDMTSAIMGMLNSTGYCHFGEGIFYVSGNIDMPEGSTIEGCGDKTIIRLLSSVTSGYCIKMTRYCTVKNLRLSGSYSELDISSTAIGGRNGIYLYGSGTRCNILSDCFIDNFSGSGIYQADTGGSTYGYLYAKSCFIFKCGAGINIDYRSEYNKYTDIITQRCHYACINNGGNNVFVGCTFHGTIGFMIDNSLGDKGNNAHGSVVGCTFNHIDNWNRTETLGGGDAILIKSATNGFIFDGCQIWYGAIRINNSRGIALSNCLIGGNTPEIEVTGGYPAFFSNCIFHASPSLNVISGTKFDNCYLDSTGASVSN